MRAHETPSSALFRLAFAVKKLHFKIAHKGFCVIFRGRKNVLNIKKLFDNTIKLFST